MDIGTKYLLLLNKKFHTVRFLFKKCIQVFKFHELAEIGFINRCAYIFVILSVKWAQNPLTVSPSRLYFDSPEEEENVDDGKLRNQLDNLRLEVSLFLRISELLKHICAAILKMNELNSIKEFEILKWITRHEIFWNQKL